MLTFADLKRLTEVAGPCLTILQPLRDSPGTPWSCLADATALLHAKGMSPAGAAEFLRPLEKFAAGTEWRERTGSVLMFRAPAFTKMQYWPDALAAAIRFADEFFILPLLADVFDDREFWLLTLSGKAVRLFRGSARGLMERALPKGAARGVPASADERMEFFAAVDHALHMTLMPHKDCESSLPLILAGLPGNLAAYRVANRYPRVLSGAIHGVPEVLGPLALGAKAMALMEEFAAMSARRAVAHIASAAAGGLLVTERRAVLDAARTGRIHELLIAPDTAVDSPESLEINSAVAAVIRDGRRISILDGRNMPDGVAAVLCDPIEETFAK